MPFSFKVPTTAPPTLNFDKTAKIKYKLKAKLKTQSQGLIASMQKGIGNMLGKNANETEFTVLGGFPEEVELHSKPIQFTADKSFIFSRSRGRLKLNGSIPRSYTGGGDLLPITITVDNESNKEVKSINIKLLSHYHFSAKDIKSEKFETAFTAPVSSSSIKKKDSLKNHLIELKLPETIIPSYKGKLINVSYTVRFPFFFFISPSLFPSSTSWFPLSPYSLSASCFPYSLFLLFARN